MQETCLKYRGGDRSYHFVVIATVIWFIIVTSGVPASRGGELQRQKQLESVETPINTWAVDLAFTAGRQARTLSGIKEGVALELDAARILLVQRPDLAAVLIQEARDRYNSWVSQAKKSDRESDLAKLLSLRQEIRVLYLTVHPEMGKVDAGSKILLDPMEANGEDNSALKAGLGDQADLWAVANDYMGVAMATLSDSPSVAAATAVQSIRETGKVSGRLPAFLAMLQLQTTRAEIEDFGKKVVELLRQDEHPDFRNLPAVIQFLNMNSAIGQESRRALLEYLVRSIAQLSNEIESAYVGGVPIEIDKNVLGLIYRAYNEDILDRVRLELPERLNVIVDALKKFKTVISDRELASVFGDVTDDTPEEQLARAERIPDVDVRQLRLETIAYKALNGLFRDKVETGDGRLDLAAQTIEAMPSIGRRSHFKDLLRIAEVAQLVEEKEYAMAISRSCSISDSMLMAWTMLGVATSENKERAGVGNIALYETAFHGIERSEHAPMRAALAFRAAEALVSLDTVRSLEMLREAVRFANAAETIGGGAGSRYEPFIITIGYETIAYHLVITGVNEISIGSDIGILAKKDWIGMFSIGESITDRQLRITFELAMCRGVLTETKRESPTPKRRGLSAQRSASR